MTAGGEAPRPPLLAITGATGFVGQAVLDEARRLAIPVRALARRPQPERSGVEWIIGTLDDAAALSRLCAGASAVLHIAGAVNVPTRADFAAANIAGTQGVIDAARTAGAPRFVHVSSLAVHHPALSHYGWSKAEAEQLVADSGLPFAVVRPPAIYGPRDTDMLELFRMAARGLVLLPPPGRASIIHVEDLARLLVRLCTMPDPPALTEPSDGAPGGYAHVELAQAVGRAVGRQQVRTLSAPAWLLGLAARGDRLVRGAKAKLTPDRAGYLAHPDWVSMPQLQPDPAWWQPGRTLDEGLRATADWYRAAGWL